MTGTTFSTFDKLNTTLTGSDLIATASAAGNNACRALDLKYSGKYYFEYTCGTVSSGNTGCGISSPTALLASIPGIAADGNTTALLKQGSFWINGGSNSGGGVFVNGTVIKYAVDLDNKKIWVKVGTNNWNGNGSADPATNVGGYDISAIQMAGVLPVVAFGASGDSFTANFGDSAFSGTVPSGFTSGWPINSSAVLQVDPGTANTAQFSSTSSGTISISTSGADRIILLFVHNEKAAGAQTVSTVSDTAGLTWHQRKQFHSVAGFDSYQEIWWAHAAAQLTGDTITVTLAGSTDDATLGVVALINADSTTPGDTDASLPATATGTSASPQVTGVSTAATETLLFGFFGSPNNVTGLGAGSGYTKLFNRTNSGGSQWSNMLVMAAYETAPVSSITVPATISGSFSWEMIVDAYKGAAVAPSGSLAATEGADAGAFSGGIVGSGSLAATDDEDSVTFVSTAGPSGSLAATETDGDTFSGSGSIAFHPIIQTVVVVTAGD